jgi:hypothetical protein
MPTVMTTPDRKATPMPATQMPKMTMHKFMVALAGVVAQIVAAGLVPAAYEPWVAVVLALLTALGVREVPNKVKPVVAPAPRHSGTP